MCQPANGRNSQRENSEQQLCGMSQLREHILIQKCQNSNILLEVFRMNSNYVIDMKVVVMTPVLN